MLRLICDIVPPFVHRDSPQELDDLDLTDWGANTQGSFEKHCLITKLKPTRTGAFDSENPAPPHMLRADPSRNHLGQTSAKQWEFLACR